MNCPYCNQEMKQGFLKSSHHMYWGENKALGFLEDEVMLTEVSLESIFRGNFVESHYCSSCKKIVVSLEDK